MLAFRSLNFFSLILLSFLLSACGGGGGGGGSSRDVFTAGPAVIEQLDATTVVEPGTAARVDPLGNLRITRIAFTAPVA